MRQNRNLYLIALAVVGLILVVVTMPAQADRNGGSTITLYSASGSVIKEWKVPGRVEFKNGMFSFVEARTDRLIEVSGTVVVSTAP